MSRGDAEFEENEQMNFSVPSASPRDMTDELNNAVSGEPMALDDITGTVVDAAVKIHRKIGPGLLESVYETLLARSLDRRGLKVERRKTVDFDYEGIHFEGGLRIDLLVEQRVIVELKSVEKLAPVHSKQLLTYLRLMKLPVGLLINFGGATLKEGLHRIVNHLDPSASPRLRVNKAVQR